ncbi:hypothetical protein KAFR_0H01030 [Kazachstania africana CBS 2517]|uniref:Exocyst complex component Sec8 n=1 Tax=Kazachstania africana (strain ATCC 22294 / BCRC 22015 / CBS 2517 / CECT 1963 / NBRC 1671 / NRRL Y-8276) TaxID=1071382 RepID=H2AYV7_KAZAF|nr:hypothetical protein KAFR_0H01030 [Kazachstania africana CBS 2517]CCF59513.1 hypothetical protein KAFR_0H01030 [Kazachstania africana CBS 2517]
MDSLAPPQGRRRRALSINNPSEGEQIARNGTLDTLENDLGLVKVQWNKVLSDKSNPLELALAFLDDTSVGLSHRYEEFNQLQERIASDLKAVVNEHSQAFNANVASYSQTVSALTDAQEMTSDIKRDLKAANDNITIRKGSLDELNEMSVHYAKTIENASLVEELLQISEKIEDSIRKEEYKNVQKLLDRGFVLLNMSDLRDIKLLQPIRHQLELQEHTLFQNMIEEVHNIIYSKKEFANVVSNILETVSIAQNGFTSLENYLYNISNIDISKQSIEINHKLEAFVTNLKQDPGYYQNIATISHEGEPSEYVRLYALLSSVKDINKLPNMLSILLDRCKEEVHILIQKCVDKVRFSHPTLLKLKTNPNNFNDFGLSINDLLSLIMRECFWEIFVKLLLAIQRHKAIFEIANSLQMTSGNPHQYRFNDIWKKMLDELDTLLSRYLFDGSLSQNDVPPTEKNGQQRKHTRQLFSLQDNLGDNSIAKEHVGELKSLLKDIFVGFTTSTNIDLDSVYIEDDFFEQEEPLLPPSVFNIKVILEPFLLFSKATATFISTELLNDSVQPPMAVFSNFMEARWLPALETTFTYLFQKKVQSNNPYALEKVGERRSVFKAATDFKILFQNVLYVLNTSNIYRGQFTEVVLSLLSRFSVYYSNIIENLIGRSKNKISKTKILSVWLKDDDLMKTEREFLLQDGSKGSLDSQTETSLLFKFCDQFYVKNKGINSSDLFNTLTLDASIYLTSTICWILSWLPDLEKPTEQSSEEQSTSTFEGDADEIRNHWALSEYGNLEALDKNLSLRLLSNKVSSLRLNKLVHEFIEMKYRLLSILRFDIRTRSIYRIGKFFQLTKIWNSDVGSIELDQNIGILLNELKTIENKLKEELPVEEKDKIFTGLDDVNTFAFIKGANSITVLNNNGIKRILRNINVLQHTLRNLYFKPAEITMGNAISFYTLAGSSEATLLNKIQSKELSFCSVEDLKTILRLQYSEELTRQVKRHGPNGNRTASNPVNKRYTEALAKIEQLEENAI